MLLLKSVLKQSQVGSLLRGFHVTQPQNVGEVYKRLWFAATGGDNFNKKIKKVRQVDIKNFNGINFGKHKIKWIGLNRLIDKDNLSAQKELVKSFESSKPRTFNYDSSSSLPKPIQIMNTRGYTNSSISGTRAGPVFTTVGSDEMRDFDSCVLGIRRARLADEYKRKNYYKVVVGVGNGHGTIGFGEGCDTRLMESIRLAKLQAASNLYTIPIYARHTIYHEIRSRYNNVVLEMDPRPIGYGIIGQRMVKKLMELVGIQNIYCKINGGYRNHATLTKAVIRALASQETTEELTERIGKYITQYTPSSFAPPKVIAMPSSYSISEYERRKYEDFDIKLPEVMSHYKGLHKPKKLNLFKPTHNRKFVPSELSRIRKVMDEGV